MKLSNGEILYALDLEAAQYRDTKHGRAMTQAADLIRSMAERINLLEAVAEVSERLYAAPFSNPIRLELKQALSKLKETV